VTPAGEQPAARTEAVPESETAAPVAAATVDTSPPTAPGRLQARLTGGLLTLSWLAAADDVAVHHYELHKDGTPVARIPADTLTTGLRGPGAGVFTLAAVDAAGNRSAGSTAIRVAPTARPAGLPKRIPGWAWKQLAWQQHGRQGSRPVAAPKRLPRWYWSWAGWRLQPLRLLP
jgi:hypothetical protein